MMLRYKEQFPFFQNSDLVYLDSAATSQKPQRVLDAMNRYYTHFCANIHRGSHSVGNQATLEYETVRTVVKDFIGAKEAEEIVFTKGTTESINMVAQEYVKGNFDHLILSSLEHHSNIVPWHLIGFESDSISVIATDENLQPDMDHFETLLSRHPGAFVSLTHVSNVFGIIHPIQEMIDLAHRYDAKVLIDGAQAVAHMPVDVKDLDADFYAFSGHKVYAPTGTGVLYGKYELLERMGVYQGGGSMIREVTIGHSSYLPSPHKYEAGTQNIASVIGMGEALRFVTDIGFDAIEAYDQKLLIYTRQRLLEIEGVRFFTESDHTTSILSFSVKGVHHDDIGSLLDKQGVIVRTGHHCAMPIMKSLGIEGTVRVSLSLYNATEDIDRFMDALTKALEMLR